MWIALLCMCTALARSVIVPTPLQLQAIRAVGPPSLPAIEMITYTKIVTYSDDH